MRLLGVNERNTFTLWKQMQRSLVFKKNRTKKHIGMVSINPPDDNVGNNRGTKTVWGDIEGRGDEML